jgi:hypothetical protein
LARRQLGEAAGFACVAANASNGALDTEAAPIVSSSADIVNIERWLRGREKAAAFMTSRLVFEDMPIQVMDAYVSGTVGSSDAGGNAGAILLEASRALQNVSTNFRGTTSPIAAATAQMGGLRNQLNKIDKGQAVLAAQAELDQINNARAILQTTSSIFGAITDPSALFNAGVNATFDAAIAAKKGEINDIQMSIAGNDRIDQYLKTSEVLRSALEDQRNAVSAVRNSALDLQRALKQYSALRSQILGNIERAKGSGAWKCDVTVSQVTVTKECRSYVNAVLNARYSGTAERYKIALKAARVAAYYARRAIEQRLGVRLQSFNRDMGPLDAPRKWASKICQMRGVDFTKLKNEAVDPADKKAWLVSIGREYADNFVGDYVDLLVQFVEQYNVNYPTQDGSDTLLLSMREDITRKSNSCEKQSINRLLLSENMGLAIDGPEPMLGQWQQHKCLATDTKCIKARPWLRPGIAVSDPLAIDNGAWLATRAPNVAPTPEQGIAMPSGYVSQAVALPAGPYILSFQDSAVDLAGAITAAVVGPYRVSILNDIGEVILTNVFTPAPGVGGVTSIYTQRTLSFTVPSNGTYRIAFAAAATPGQNGSVVVYQPQLERDSGNGRTSYQATDAQGLTRSSDCASTPKDLRNAFNRVCDPTKKELCYYESKKVFTMNTQTQSINGYSLAAKVASNNFNYRHVDFALNLVGNGVRNCDENPSPGCYSAGSIDYDLVHEANQVPILNYNGEPTRFDFGEGAIRHGKALTTERYLTFPLSAADTGLLASTGVTKTELRGRPLDGRYRIRIYDNPALRWSNLEDVQLMIRYRYWTKVVSPSRP